MSVAVGLFDSAKAVAQIFNSSLFILHFFIFHFLERSVAHAARGAQSSDDRCDDARDDLENGLPGFLVGLHNFINGLLVIHYPEGCFFSTDLSLQNFISTDYRMIGF